MANNVSSGLEPVFAAEFSREIRTADGSKQRVAAVDYAVALYRRLTGVADALPPSLVTGTEVDPDTQLRMQAALQKHVDNAIAKTVTVPANFDYARFQSLFDTAYRLGLKGCTAFRPNAVTGSVLVQPDASDVDRCCPEVSL